jgi:hypothetical protein
MRVSAAVLRPRLSRQNRAVPAASRFSAPETHEPVAYSVTHARKSWHVLDPRLTDDFAFLETQGLGDWFVCLGILQHRADIGLLVRGEHAGLTGGEIDAGERRGPEDARVSGAENLDAAGTALFCRDSRGRNTAALTRVKRGSSTCQDLRAWVTE